MKIVRFLAIISAALLAFAIGVVLFAPWRTIASYAIERARLAAVNKGIYIDHTGIDVNGGISPEFMIRELSAETPMAKIELVGVTLKTDVLASIFSGGINGSISFRGGKMTIVPNLEVALSAGSTNFIASRSSAAINDAVVNGDISLTGDLEMDLASGKVAHSTISFSAREDIDRLFANPMLSSFIRKNDDGRWVIRYGSQ